MPSTSGYNKGSSWETVWMALALLPIALALIPIPLALIPIALAQLHKALALPSIALALPAIAPVPLSALQFVCMERITGL